MKIAICDDIKTDAESVYHLIRQYEAEKNIETDCRIFCTYEEMLRSGTDYDVFVLDYKMPGMNGMDFARRMRETYSDDKTVIFVTSFPEIVYEAFEVRTHRFLIKPIEKTKFFEALDACFKPSAINKKTIIKSDGKTELLDFEDVMYFESDKNNIRVYLRSKTNCLSWRKTITSAEEDLKKYGFFRVHRAYLVNLYQVKSFDNKYITMSNGEDIPISAKKHADFCKAYIQAMAE
ncbi:MAG: response regulator transcription factor [Clostridia bacterium]|nr:response regulator transcription factor [Clostridia bacterium]